MIERTALLVDQLDQENAQELEKRYARQTRLRLLDSLLDRFEALNLHDAQAAPPLTREVYALAREDHHPLLHRPLDTMSNADWMDVVYDLQDPWLLPADDRDNSH